MTARPGWRSLISARMLIMLLTGFSSGLPYMLTGSTLQAWLKDENVSLQAIGFFSLVGLPYTLKFLWSPLLDRWIPPFLGRRRGWALIAQVALALAIAGLGMSHPAASPWTVALLALLLTFTAATQDIVLDAYRREFLPDGELGSGTSIFVTGYRIAMIVSGALALVLADLIPWPAVYLTMSALMVVGIATVLLSPEPQVPSTPKTLREAVIQPFVDFFRRPGAWTILAFILLYKIGDLMASTMTTPFALEMGFTKTEIAGMIKLFGLGAMILGGIVGAPIMAWLGINRSLWVFGVFQSVSILAFAALAQLGRSYPALALAVSLEYVAWGMGATAISAFMAELTNKRFTATQFALFTSLARVPGVILASPTGIIAAALGWNGFFIFCALSAIPGLLLLFVVAPWNGRRAAENARAEA